jgi:signal transduction histidine kinase
VSQVRVTGHGLGLSIVRRIMEKLNGEVGLESVPDQGSIFSFILPAFSEDGETAVKVAEPS